MTGKEALINLSKTCMAYQEEFGRLKIDKRDNEALQTLREIVQKYNKYKKAFKILREKFFIDLIERKDDWKLGFEPINPIEGQPRFSQLPREEAELLEELTNDERSV